MSLNSKPLRIASIGDIHLGHRRTDTEYITKNLDKYFTNDEFISQCDIIFIEGDVFDDLLSMANEAVYFIKSWIAKLLRLCVRYDVILRVLEGTPSHDRNQSNHFVSINEIHYENSGVRANLEYIKTLSVEHIDRFGIDVLYVPDEWNHDTADTLIEVKELLQAKGLKQVDYACMHGCFTFQIPEITKPNIKHIESEYLALVKELIFIGHVHKCAQFERIYAAGSFERLAHGEEEKKGFLYSVIDSPGHHQVDFIENKEAKKYLTYKCYQDDMEETLLFIEKKLKKVPEQSFIRIETRYDNPIATGLDILKRRWPLLVWSILIKKKEDTVESVSLIDEEKYIPIIINKETITSLVLQRLKTLNLNPGIEERALFHLEEVC